MTLDHLILSVLYMFVFNDFKNKQKLYERISTRYETFTQFAAINFQLTFCDPIFMSRVIFYMHSISIIRQSFSDSISLSFWHIWSLRIRKIYDKLGAYEDK